MLKRTRRTLAAELPGQTAIAVTINRIIDVDVSEHSIRAGRDVRLRRARQGWHRVRPDRFK